MHNLFSMFQGHDDRVSLAFAQGFDGKIARFGDLIMEVTENTIVEATSLPQTSDKWFKKLSFGVKYRNQFPKKKYRDVDWSKVVPREWLKK